MQLIAHSVVPSTPVPYLYLGYLSATTTEQPFRNIGLLFSIILIAFGLLMAIGRFRQLRKVLIGLLIAACGFGALALTRTYLDNGPVRYQHPLRVTESTMHSIREAISQRLMAGGSIPGDLHELETDLASHSMNPTIDDQYLKDGWMHPIVLRRLDNPAILYELASAGPDEKFGTEDDVIVQSQTNPQAVD